MVLVMLCLITRYIAAITDKDLALEKNFSVRIGSFLCAFVFKLFTCSTCSTDVDTGVCLCLLLSKVNNQQLGLADAGQYMFSVHHSARLSISSQYELSLLFIIRPMMVVNNRVCLGVQSWVYSVDGKGLSTQPWKGVSANHRLAETLHLSILQLYGSLTLSLDATPVSAIRSMSSHSLTSVKLSCQ